MLFSSNCVLPEKVNVSYKSFVTCLNKFLQSLSEWVATYFFDVRVDNQNHILSYWNYWYIAWTVSNDQAIWTVLPGLFHMSRLFKGYLTKKESNGVQHQITWFDPKKKQPKSAKNVFWTGSEINCLTYLLKWPVDEKIHWPSTFFNGQNNNCILVSHTHSFQYILVLLVL